MEDKNVNNVQSAVEAKNKSIHSFFSKRRIKNLFQFANLHLQIPDSPITESKSSPATPTAATPSPKKSPTSVVPSSGSSSNSASPKAHTPRRNNFFVLPYSSGDLYDEYDLTTVEIGRGKNGVVRKCIHKFSGEVMACKSVDKAGIIPNGRKAKALVLEVKLSLVVCNHPNVVRIHKVHEDSQNLHFVMEKCRGDLYDYITIKGRLTEKESACMLRKICEAVGFCHSKGVIHRDIKPENIMLVEGDMEPKLGDFGEAFVMSYGKYPSGIAGSPPYMAPEIILGLPYGYAVDVWSLGILLYIMLSGMLPFHGSSPSETFKCILSYEPNLTVSPWDEISTGAKILIRRMLCKDPNKRISIKEVLSDFWIQINGA